MCDKLRPYISYSILKCSREVKSLQALLKPWNLTHFKHIPISTTERVHVTQVLSKSFHFLIGWDKLEQLCRVDQQISNPSLSFLLTCSSISLSRLFLASIVRIRCRISWSESFSLESNMVQFWALFSPMYTFSFTFFRGNVP